MTIFLIIFFSLLAALLESYAIYAFIKKTLSKASFIYLTIYAAVLIVFGISFITHQSFKQFGFLHLMLIAVSFLTAPMMVTLVKKRIAHLIILYSFSVISLYFTAIKFTYSTPFFTQLPFNICNIAAVFIIIRPFVKNKAFDNYILCFAMLGGIFNIILGTVYGSDFYLPSTYESNLIHHLYIPMSLYLFLTREARPDLKAAAKNFYWLVPVFIIFVFLNQIYKYNYFFTGIYQNPILGVYNLFPVFSLKIFGFNFEFNILYYILIIALSFGIQLLLSYLYRLADKKLPSSLFKEFPAPEKKQPSKVEDC